MGSVSAIRIAALISSSRRSRGAALLNSWGLLDELVASDTPAATRARFDIDGVMVAGDFPTVDGVGAVYSPRRLLLDDVLVRAARRAGAEIREGFTVQELLWSAGRVIGIRGRAGSGGVPVTERSTLVIGADGKHSTVARRVGARRYRARHPASFASYGYWAGVPLDATARLYSRHGLAVAAFPTNDELSVVFVAQPRGGFDAYRRDVEDGFLAAADRCDDLGERLRDGHRVERIRTTPDLPQAVTVQHGPGWALAGDAGAVMDPVTAQGITHALRDASRLSAAILAGTDDPGQVDTRLAAAQRQRDAVLRPVFDGTARLARLPALNPVQRALLATAAEQPTLAAAFIAAFTGARPWQDSMTPTGMVRRLGARGVLVSTRRLLIPARRSQRVRSGRLPGSPAVPSARSRSCVPGDRPSARTPARKEGSTPSGPASPRL
jgi:2-polyprenyl-6-methoxyphenol hydroxylase-like FAD-dependent oxidoreductase